MGLISQLKDLMTGSTIRLEELAAVLRARLDGPDGPATLGLEGRSRAGYDRLLDALNRLPRPFMALGTLALIAAALIEPVWFAGRMEALAQIPEPLWWLIGAVVSLFFGARFQTQGQAFQREIVGALVLGAAPPLPKPTTPFVAATGADAQLTLSAEAPSLNPALDAWQASPSHTAT